MKEDGKDFGDEEKKVRIPATHLATLVSARAYPYTKAA